MYENELKKHTYPIDGVVYDITIIILLCSLYSSFAEIDSSEALCLRDDSKSLRLSDIGKYYNTAAARRRRPRNDYYNPEGHLNICIHNADLPSCDSTLYYIILYLLSIVIYIIYLCVICLLAFECPCPLAASVYTRRFRHNCPRILWTPFWALCLNTCCTGHHLGTLCSIIQPQVSNCAARCPSPVYREYNAYNMSHSSERRLSPFIIIYLS